MREALAARDNERFRIRAAVSRRGKRRTILLVDGVDASSGESLFDHLWMKIGKWARVPEGNDWRAIRSGDVIEFDARTGPYVKGYFGTRKGIEKPPALDWKMFRPTKLKLISAAQPKALLLSSDARGDMNVPERGRRSRRRPRGLV